MKSLLQRSFILVAFLFATNCPAPVFMKLGDIKGEATAPGHREWIDVLTLTNPFNAASPRGNPSSSLVLTKPVDKASPKLFQYCASGTAVPEARLEWTDNTGSDTRFLEIRLHDVLVSSYSNLAQGDGSVVPTESLTLNYEKVTWTYTKRHLHSQLPQELQSTSVNLEDGTTSSTTAMASFSMTGIRKPGGQMELQWQGIAGRTYDVYAVSTLTGPFSLRGQTTATAAGTMTHTEAILPGTMFFVVEERP